MDENIFAEKLREFRNRNGMTQDQLAEKLFVTRKAVSKWERAKCYPNLATLAALADIMQVTIDDLVRDGRCRDESLKVKAQRNRYFAARASVYFLWCLMMSAAFIGAYFFVKAAAAAVCVTVCVSLLGIAASVWMERRTCEDVRYISLRRELNALCILMAVTAAASAALAAAGYSLSAMTTACAVSAAQICYIVCRMARGA